MECQHFNDVRENYFKVKDVLVDNMKDLFEKVPLRKILGFLREAGLYDLI